jgi:hypothetical protein
MSLQVIKIVKILLLERACDQDGACLEVGRRGTDERRGVLVFGNSWSMTSVIFLSCTEHVPSAGRTWQSAATNQVSRKKKGF